MKGWHFLIALQTIATAVGLFGLASFYGDHLLDPAVPREATTALRASFALIIVLTLCVFGALLWKREHAADAVMIVAVVAMAVTALAGYAPRLVNDQVRQQEALDRIAGYRRNEQNFLAEFAQRKEEIEARLRDHRPLTPDDSLELLMFLGHGDFRNFDLADHTPANLALLRRTLSAKIVDPNAAVAGEQHFGVAASAAAVDAVAQQLAALEAQPNPTEYELNGLKSRLHMLSHNHKRFLALRGKPLFLFYYEAVDLGGSIKYHVEHSMTHEWEIMELLVQYGADLSRSDAAPLVADLAAWKSRAAPTGGDAR